MKLLMCIAVLMLSSVQAHAQVTGNVLSRVFQIRFNGSTGTAFVIDFEDQQYIITANHMVVGAGTQAKVDVFGGGDSEWHSFDFKILHGPSQCADVAVLIPVEKRVSTADPIPYPYNYLIGQEAYFLGFPYGLYTSFAKQKQAVALVKHGYISASVSCAAIYPNASQDEGLMLLDGLNNPGFSGGPVVAPDVSAPNHAFKLVGVISGYKSENVQLNVNGQATANASVATNTGIILVVPIQRVVEIIKEYRDSEKKK
jgi:S1-C subfamily serine protease